MVRDERRKILLERMTTAWAMTAARDPQLDWGASSPEIDKAELEFETLAAKYLDGAIDIESLKSAFDARTAAYRKAIKQEVTLFEQTI